jgi:hypothetical protein
MRARVKALTYRVPSGWASCSFQWPHCRASAPSPPLQPTFLRSLLLLLDLSDVHRIHPARTLGREILMSSEQNQPSSESDGLKISSVRQPVGAYLAATTAGTSAASSGRRLASHGTRDADPGRGSAEDDRVMSDSELLLRRNVGRPDTLTAVGTRLLPTRSRETLLEKLPKVRSVVISGVALLQLVKEWQRAGKGSASKRTGVRSMEGAASEAYCTGQLVGYLEVERRSDPTSDDAKTADALVWGDVMHVTAAFPAPRLSVIAGGRSTSGSAPTSLPAAVIANQMQQRGTYLWERCRLLREASRENLIVGWFCVGDTRQLSSFVNAEWTETQFQHQFWLKNAVCVVFDPLRRHSSGTLGIRVVRLSDAFMREYSRLMDYRVGGSGSSNKGSAALQAYGRGGGRVAAGSTFVSEALRDLGLCSQTMIEDVPFTVHASALSEQYLAWSALQHPQARENAKFTEHAAACDSDVQRLSLRRDGVLVEETAGGLIQDLDEVTREQSRYHHFLRNYIRIQNQQHEWLRRRRAENEHRRQQGQEPLPEEPLPAHLSSYSEPSRLEPMMTFRDLSETLRDLELVIGGRCEKQVTLESFKTV